MTSVRQRNIYDQPAHAGAAIPKLSIRPQLPQASAEPSCNAFMKPLVVEPAAENRQYNFRKEKRKDPGIHVYAKPMMKSHSTAERNHNPALYYGTEKETTLGDQMPWWLPEDDSTTLSDRFINS
jgi:hypothetical protein